MAKQIMVTGRKVLVAIGSLLLIGLVALILPDCTRARVVVVNNSTSVLEDLTLIMRDRVVWSGRLDTRERQRIAVAESTGDSFVLEGRYAESGARFEGISSYAMNYSGLTHLFLVKDDGVHIGAWYAPPWPWSEEAGVLDKARYFGAMLLHFMSCADHALWTLIRGSPRY